MLGVCGVVALSPELGIKNRNTDSFFIKKPEDLKELVVQNQIWIFNTMKKLQS